MELFILYVITRLTELKLAFDKISNLSLTVVVVGIVMYAVFQLFTSKEDLSILKKLPKKTLDGPYHLRQEHTNEEIATLVESSGVSTNKIEEALQAHAVKKCAVSIFKIFLPIYLISSIMTTLMPTGKDAVIVAAGVGLDQAIRNEEVKKTFSKSAKVVTAWFDAQLNEVSLVEGVKEKAKESADKVVQEAKAEVSSAIETKKEISK